MVMNNGRVLAFKVYLKAWDSVHMVAGMMFHHLKMMMMIMVRIT